MEKTKKEKRRENDLKLIIKRRKRRKQKEKRKKKKEKRKKKKEKRKKKKEKRKKKKEKRKREQRRMNLQLKERINGSRNPITLLYEITGKKEGKPVRKKDTGILNR